MTTQWAAQFLVSAELERHGYVVSFTMGHATKAADLMVGHEGTGAQFWVDVKGLAKPTSWPGGGTKAPRKNLFYILVLVCTARENDRFSILSQSEWDGLVNRYGEEHPNQKSRTGGFNWTAPHRFENQWSKLPSWRSRPN